MYNVNKYSVPIINIAVIIPKVKNTNFKKIQIFHFHTKEENDDKNL